MQSKFTIRIEMSLVDFVSCDSRYARVADRYPQLIMTEEQSRYLTAPETLASWAPFTL